MGSGVSVSVNFIQCLDIKKKKGFMSILEGAHHARLHCRRHQPKRRRGGSTCWVTTKKCKPQATSPQISRVPLGFPYKPTPKRVPLPKRATPKRKPDQVPSAHPTTRPPRQVSRLRTRRWPRASPALPPSWGPACATWIFVPAAEGSPGRKKQTLPALEAEGNIYLDPQTPGRSKYSIKHGLVPLRVVRGSRSPFWG